MEQGISQALSPDAAVFVPRQFSIDGTLHIEQIPSYITNCYPFVPVDSDRQRNVGRHGRSPPPFLGPSPRPSNQRFLRSYPGFGNRMPGPQNFNPSIPPPLDNTWIMPPTTVPPMNFLNFPPPDVHFNQDKELLQKDSPRVPAKPAWSPHDGESKAGHTDRREQRRGSGSEGKRRNQRSRNSSGKSNTSDGQREDSKVSLRSKKRERIKSGGARQEETTVSQLSVQMRDTAVQTEFSETFANQTLAQYPSPMFNPNLSSPGKSRMIGSSSEDSDSGYHSPLHRKNQVTSGTQPGEPVPTQQNNNSKTKAGKSVERIPTNQTLRAKEKEASQQIFSYAFIAQSKPVIESSLKSEPEVGPTESKKTEGEESGNEGKKKRKRNRRKRKKKKEENSETAEEKPEVDLPGVELYFQDEEEFPNLSVGQGKVGVAQRQPPISYSSVLSQTKTSPQRNGQKRQEELNSKSEIDPPGDHVRNPRRRRKKIEIVQQAAEEELAEISLEQQMLRELNLKSRGRGHQTPTITPGGQPRGHQTPTLTTPGGQSRSTKTASPQPGILKVPVQNQPMGKKTKQGISLDLSAMIDALEKKKPEAKKPVDQKVTKFSEVKAKENKKPGVGHNLLDSSAPQKRGKERENPKAKKPSSLKKVILKEREEKKKMRLLDDAESANNGVSLGIGVVSGNESDLSQDAFSSKGSVVDYTGTGTPASNDLSPISQTSPISMSPLSPGVSPQSSEVNSPIAGTIGKEVRMKIHSRRFREYCNQVLNKDIDSCCTHLLQDLVRFQDRMYHKDPVKAKTKRRIVLGLREVTKHLKLSKIKLVIISPNLEKIQSKGGLDDALNNILNLCNDQNVPFVFALGRRALGRACAKLVPVSVVGIFNYSGTEENFHNLMELSEQARQSYKEMVNVIEREIRDYPTLGAAAAVPHIYAHMGHSRTPSGASVLSFTSSLLSEPISENYPHSEPETDSAGYELPRTKNNPPPSISRESIQAAYESQMRLIYPQLDVDEGNEADTEEGVTKGHHHDEGSSDSDPSSEEDTMKALPHIDSIHSSTYDLSTDILSQNSGRTVDNCDAISTHSSRTLGDGSSTLLADPGERSRHGTPKSTESPSNTLQRGKVIDSERIQNWVDQTKSRLEDLRQLQENSETSSEGDSSEEDTVDELNLSSDRSNIQCDKAICGTDPKGDKTSCGIDVAGDKTPYEAEPKGEKTPCESDPKSEKTQCETDPKSEKKCESDPKSEKKCESDLKNEKKCESDPKNEKKCESDPKNGMMPCESDPKSEKKPCESDPGDKELVMCHENEKVLNTSAETDNQEFITSGQTTGLLS
ncbi:selenocysteine insertion sequence-binding protein 2-like [Saccostrea echinata]|uniref:selenocysteine insertion sequence-binding protein 2-like n=1 Tax=Saccostrea echinata TaxID=191078 RepID=UPI002A8075B8|nr:selenocysteine insertion sequence-binding protein 2-like [Saccostrea echinata]